MPDKKIIIACLVAFAAGYFAKGYLTTANAADVDDEDEEGKEEAAED